MNTNMNENMKIETIYPCPIAYIRKTGAYGKGNIRAMEQLKQWARDGGLMNKKTVIFGIPQDNPQTTARENCRYDACIALPEEYPLVTGAIYDKQLPAGGNVQYGELSGGTYAVFTVSHTAEAVAQAWIDIFSLLSANGYLPDATRPILERYQAELVAQHLCEICVPVDSSTIIS
ncbi:AraC family transcriptional regulator [Anoxybacterium hadale]